MNHITLTETNFDQEVLSSDTPVLVDFWAEWCVPCKAVAPVVEEIAETYRGRLKVGKVNVDENNQLAMRFGVMSIPTLKLFKQGKVAGEVIGAAPKSVLEDAIKKVL